MFSCIAGGRAYDGAAASAINRRLSDQASGDMPELTQDDWKAAVRCKVYRPAKARIAAHLDEDVLAWRKADAGGCQTRMNAILRRKMPKAWSFDSQKQRIRGPQNSLCRFSVPQITISA
jgi:uncharacterized protein (DUF4415 family)